MQHITCQTYDLVYATATSKQEIIELLKFFWRRELLRPLFYQTSMRLWRSNFAEEVQFILAECDRLYCYRLFGGRPLALIILQESGCYRECEAHFYYFPHLCCPLSSLINLFCKLRDELFKEGFEVIRVSYLKQNFTLKKLLDAVGFVKLPLTNSYGAYRNKKLIWQTAEIRRLKI